MKHYNPNLSAGALVPPPPFSNPLGAIKCPEFLRVRDIVRPHGILPLGRSSWYSLVAKKKVGPGVLISPGVRVWSRAEVLAFASGEVRQ